ncbi:phage late control D family protein, partial [Yersinia enterocolitica]
MISGIALPAGADMAPDFMLNINAKDITQNIRDRLLSLSLTDNR